MNKNEKLLNQGFDCINNGDIPCAKRVLDELKQKEDTPYLKFIISQLLLEIGYKNREIEHLDEAITNLEEIEEYSFDDFYYYLGNAYIFKYNLLTEKPDYLTKDDNHLLLKSKNSFKRAIVESSYENLRRVKINLANVYDDVGRTIEALDHYDEIINEWGSAYALVNKAIALYEYSKFINNPTPVLSEAYDILNLIMDDFRSSKELSEKCRYYLEKIQWLFDGGILKREVKNDLKRPSDDTFRDFMVNYCLDNKLYLNLCNFCQQCGNAIGDTIVIEKMMCELGGKTDDELYFTMSYYLNQIKMDFISSRFLLILSQYDGFNLDIIAENIYLAETPFGEENDIRTQLLKDAFKNFFNILDKIAFFINEYFGLEIGKKVVDFRRVWFNYNENGKERGSKIHEKLISKNNLGLTALYDIYLELNDKNDKKYLRDTRNALTHRFLRITDNKQNNDDKTADELREETIELAILVKNAIIYLIRLVKINELEDN